MSAYRDRVRGQHRLNDNRQASPREARIAVGANGLLIPSPPRVRAALPGYSSFVGRVGALAVALGVGIGFATATPGLARADEPGSSAPADEPAQDAPEEPSNPTDPTGVATPAPEPGSVVSPTNDSPAGTGDAPSGVPETGVVQGSVVHTGSYGPNAVPPSSVDEAPAEQPVAPPPAEVPVATAPVEAVSTPAVEPAPTQTVADPITPVPESPSPATPPAEYEAPASGGDTPVAEAEADVAAGNDGAAAVSTTGAVDVTAQAATTGDDTDTATAHLPVGLDPGDDALLSALDAAPAPAADPVAAFLAIPVAAANLVIGVVSAILTPFLAPGPVAPAQPPLLFAVLEWFRREIQRTFFNRSPVGFDNAYTTSEGDDVTGNVLTDGTDDTDPDSDALRASLVDGPDHGEVTLNADGTFTYTPDENFTGTDTFTYKVTDTGFHLHGLFGIFSPDGGHADTATVTVSVTGDPANQMPVTMGDNYTVTENDTLTVSGPGVLANDTDPDGDPLTAVKVSDPTHGDVTFNADGSFTYTPDADFVGTDSFEYYAYDGTTEGNPAIVNITVTEDLPNTAPVANYDSFATGAGQAFTFDEDDLLDNDFDAEGDGLTALVTQEPANGQLVDNGDGTYTYTPDAGFVGTDTFQYSAHDGTNAGNLAVVSINVGIPANSVPEATPDDIATRVDTPRIITPDELVGDDTDADGDALTPYVVSDPAHGTLEAGVGGTWVYTPDPGFTGIDSFYYTAFDGYADSTPTLVNITVAGQPTGNSQAVAGYDSFGTDADTPLTIDPDTLSANDFDADGDPLTVNVTEGPQHGTLVTDPMGNLVYTPDAGFTGVDGFYYSAGYPENAGTPALVTIHVGEPANAAPQATPDTLVTGIGAPLTITEDDLLGNDVDPEGETLYVYVVSDPEHGTLEDNGDGTFTYTSDPMYVGTDSFYYTAFDGESDSLPTLVTINVGGVVNEPPVANDDALSTGVDEPLTITIDDLTGNDEDPDGDPLLPPSLVDPPTNGVFSYGGDGTVVYTPNAGFEGVDSFTYTVSDGTADSNVATVYITVGNPPVNTAPVPGFDSFATPAGTPLTLTPTQLLANDVDAENDTLTVQLGSPPEHGTVDVDAMGNIVYTPEAGYTGLDSFGYRAFDGTAISSYQAIVTVNVGGPQNASPQAVPDQLNTDVDTPLTIAFDDLVGDDLDPDGPNALVPYIALEPTHGTLERDSGAQTFTYTPDAGFEGVDTFSYTAYDGSADSLPVTVTITVGNPVVNTAPVPGFDSLATPLDTDLIIDVNTLLANDFDAEGDPMTVAVAQNPIHGDLIDNGDGTYTYTPDAGYTGLDSFTYVTDDGTDGSNYAATVVINVGGPANTTPQAAPDDLATDVDTPLVIDWDTDLLDNDADTDGPEQLVAYIAGQPGHGTLTAYSAGRTFTYTPEPGFEGVDSFYYTAFDGYSDSMPVLVTITVGNPPVNTAPVPGFDSFATPAGTPLTLTPTQLLANDVDAENDTLTVQLGSPPEHGTVDVDAMGNIVYTPEAGYTGLDSFGYRAFDGTAISSYQAIVTVNVGGPQNASPQAVPDQLNTDVDTPLTIAFDDLVGDDLDPDGPNALVPYIALEPTHGTLERDSGAQTFTYTPDAGFEGVDTFSYTAYDGSADSLPVTVTITVVSQM